MPSVLLERSSPPDDTALHQALGRANVLWTELDPAAEGRAVRIDVRTKADLRDVQRLAALKMAH